LAVVTVICVVVSVGAFLNADAAVQLVSLGRVDTETGTLAASPVLVCAAAADVECLVWQLFLESAGHTDAIAQANVSRATARRLIRLVVAREILRCDISTRIVAYGMAEKNMCEEHEGGGKESTFEGLHGNSVARNQSVTNCLLVEHNRKHQAVNATSLICACVRII
jgi:hypothetical protein